MSILLKWHFWVWTSLQRESGFGLFYITRSTVTDDRIWLTWLGFKATCGLGSRSNYSIMNKLAVSSEHIVARLCKNEFLIASILYIIQISWNWVAQKYILHNFTHLKSWKVFFWCKLFHYFYLAKVWNYIRVEFKK